MPSAAQLPPNPDPVLNVPVTPELVEKHGLRPEEYDSIRAILGREPTLTELGIFSVMWSEHCSYKNSKKLLKGFPVEKRDAADGAGRVLVKAGEENAGVIDIGHGWAVAFKIESHNHPSAVEPFEGAATGVGGIIRDIFTMGARPVLLTNSLRFGDLDSPTAQRLFRGVVSGISHYGNCMGIPNVGGDVVFDPCYEGNPLVNAQCLGLLRHSEIKRGAASGVGNPVYYVGAATGRDGLGGAAFASKELSEASHEDRPAVQKGDPFMEKLLMEACLEMMAIDGLVVGIQDMGAAGLTCSSCETASRGGTGIEIDLDKTPQREPGMNAYEIMLSESQERMLVIAQKGRERELERVFEKWDLHACQVGRVAEGNRMTVTHRGVVVADIPADALTDKAPLYDRESRRPAYLDEVQSWTPERLPDLDGEALGRALPELLAHPTIASKNWVYRQYDHMVMAHTAVEPGSDAAVVRLQLEEGREACLAIANDGNAAFCYLNPYKGGQIVVAECVRNLACAGARPIGMTDNLNFGNPYKPEVYYAMAESVRGLADACRAFDVPVSGGNVSLYNENRRGAIDPTPVVSVVGLIDKPANIRRQFCQRPGLSLVLLGGLPDELGGSAYLRYLRDLKTGDAPDIDLEREKRQNAFLLRAIDAGWVQAAHDVSEGGLLCCVAEMLFENPSLGVALELGAPARADAALFGESQGRIVAAVAPDKEPPLLEAARSAGVEALRLGAVDDSGILAVQAGACRASWKTSQLRDAWIHAIGGRMKRPGLED